MFADVNRRIHHKNQILFSRKSASLQAFRNPVCEQTHLTLVLWAFDCLQIPLHELMSKYPNETAILSAYDCSLAWAHGAIKMPLARKAILDCHAVAKKLDDACDIALCHAVGQGCATVHVETHALGLVCYELTALVIKCGYADYEEAVCDKISFYTDKLVWWQEHTNQRRACEAWADFLIRPSEENKVKRLMNQCSD